MSTRPYCESLVALTLVACGGQVASATSPASDGGSGEHTTVRQDAETPFDASGAPTAFVMDCTGSPPIAFKLPCAVGQSPLNVTECYAVDSGPSYSLPVLVFIVPLPYMASHRNEPIDLSAFPSPPYGMPLVAGGVPYGATHRGTLTVSEVDVTQRTYVGRLKGIEFTGWPDGGDPIVCSAADALIWTVPGGFE